MTYTVVTNLFFGGDKLWEVSPVCWHTGSAKKKIFCKLKRMVKATQRFSSSLPATPAMQPYSHFVLDASPMDKGEENVEC
jgi:hypothetical protein